MPAVINFPVICVCWACGMYFLFLSWALRYANIYFNVFYGLFQFTFVKNILKILKHLREERREGGWEETGSGLKVRIDGWGHHVVGSQNKEISIWCLLWRFTPYKDNSHSAGTCCILYQKSSQTLSVIINTIIKAGLARYDLWSNSGMNIIGLTKFFLIGFKSHFLKCNLYLAPLLDVANQDTVAPTGKPVIVIIFCGYAIKLILNDLFLFW